MNERRQNSWLTASQRRLGRSNAARKGMRACARGRGDRRCSGWIGVGAKSGLRWRTPPVGPRVSLLFHGPAEMFGRRR